MDPKEQILISLRDTLRYAIAQWLRDLGQPEGSCLPYAEDLLGMYGYDLKGIAEAIAETPSDYD